MGTPWVLAAKGTAKSIKEAAQQITQSNFTENHGVEILGGYSRPFRCAEEKILREAVALLGGLVTTCRSDARRSSGDLIACSRGCCTMAPNSSHSAK